jgi:23S rRNA (pseudouridine1915-N3)-methyltransferase
VKISVAAPGKPSHPGAVAWTDDLQGRIARIVPFRRLHAREQRRGHGRDAEAKAKESQALRALLEPQMYVVGLEVGGVALDSDRFFAWLVGQAEKGQKELCFLIGGPDGLDADARAVCRQLVSLGPMTLPHELAEVVLLEQIYRALTRWKGLPYHR